jgi:hypothetical protein
MNMSKAGIIIITEGHEQLVTCYQCYQSLALLAKLCGSIRFWGGPPRVIGEGRNSKSEKRKAKSTPHVPYYPSVRSKVPVCLSLS